MLLYAVVPAEATAPDVSGLVGRRLDMIQGALVAIIAEECSERPHATKDESQVFAKIICEIAAITPMLPIRFPTILPTRSAVLAELQAHERSWRSRLTKLDGSSEVVIRARWDNTEDELDAESRSSGTSYLRSRAAALQQRDALVAEISELVRNWAREIKVLPSQQGIRIACLVANSDVPKLNEAVLGWQHAAGHRQVAVGGPWPPFSFVGDQEAVSA
jgi:hypothetical protein